MIEAKGYGGLVASFSIKYCRPNEKWHKDKVSLFRSVHLLPFVFPSGAGKKHCRFQTALRIMYMVGRFLSRCALWPTGYCLRILLAGLIIIGEFITVCSFLIAPAFGGHFFLNDRVSIVPVVVGSQNQDDFHSLVVQVIHTVSPVPCGKVGIAIFVQVSLASLFRFSL